MDDDRGGDFGFRILKWPVDVFALELGLGYGVLRLLTATYAPEPIPSAAKLGAWALLSMVCLAVVVRYVPADTNFFHYKSSIPLWTWNLLIFLFIIGVPTISILHGQSGLFWAMALLATSAKAVYSLEDLRRRRHVGHPPPTREEIRQRRILAGDRVPAPPASIQITVTQGWCSRHLYRQKPGAFALRAWPTSVLLFIALIGIAMVVGGLVLGNASLVVIGTAVQGAATCVYVALSTASQVYALRTHRPGLQDPSDPIPGGSTALARPGQ